MSGLVQVVANDGLDCDEFLRGQIDCQNGVQHKAGQSESYDRGYATEYEREQVASELSRRGLWVSGKH